MMIILENKTRMVRLLQTYLLNKSK